MVDVSEKPFVVVEAPARFAVIAPRAPVPAVVVASSDQISDLIGYYSIKEAGLQGLVEKYQPYERSVPVYLSIIRFMTGISREDRERYLTFDVWLFDEYDGRERLYSLIIDTPKFSRGAIRKLKVYREEISTQLERVISAWNTNDVDQITYFGQMLAAIISFLMDDIQLTRDRSDKLRYIYTTIFVGYIIIMMAYVTYAVLITGGDPGSWRP